MPQMGMPGAGVAGITPLPRSEMVAGELLALLVIETLPLELPVEAGVKITFSVAD